MPVRSGCCDGLPVDRSGAAPDSGDVQARKHRQTARRAGPALRPAREFALMSALQTKPTQRPAATMMTHNVREKVAASRAPNGGLPLSQADIPRAVNKWKTS